MSYATYDSLYIFVSLFRFGVNKVSEFCFFRLNIPNGVSEDTKS